jgi:hypothetical protein
MGHEFESFSEHLRASTAAIAYQYFLLPIAGGDPKYRERVYCYELYHQMRTAWPLAGYSLNGEVDKSGHPLLRERVGAVKPDLLIHVPGTMSHNLVVMEVKPAFAKNDGIEKDIETLSCFISEANYTNAVYLFYGHEPKESLLTRVGVFASNISEGVEIELWLHSEVGHAAERIGRFDRSGFHADSTL